MRIETDHVYDVNMEEASVPIKGAYHHGNLRSALIEAGLTALASGQEGELSLRFLARQVGVTANAAYRHFADKDDLLNALAAEGFRRFAQGQTDAIAGKTEPALRLQASGMAYIAFATSHAPLFRLMFARVGCMGEHAELMQASRDSMGVLLESAAAQVNGQPGDEHAVIMAAACWALVHGLSDLALGGQLAVFGLPPQELIAKVMSLPALMK
jgi:AcrR family transcriptional regulator